MLLLSNELTYISSSSKGWLLHRTFLKPPNNMVNILNNRSNNRGNSNKGERSMVRSEGNKVYVSNIDFSCTHQDVKDAFKQVGDVAFVEMLKDDNQKSKGCAIVRFKDSNIAEEVIRKMNRYELNGRKLVVKDEQAAPRDDGMRSNHGRKRPREDDHYDRQRSMPDNNNSLSNNNTYGLSTQFLQSLGIELPLVNRIFVANLDYSVSQDNIKELFTIAGNVVDIEIARGEDGKSKGYAFVEFDHPIEAIQAISMLHNQIYMERPMNVQLTRKESRKDGPMRLPSGLKGIGMGLGINGAPLKNVAHTVEAGNQSSLLGAMPTGSGAAFGNQMNMGAMSQTLNPAMGLGLGGGLVGGIQGGGMPNMMSSGLASGVSGGVMGQDMNSLGRGGGMGLLDRPPGLSVGVGYNSSLAASSSLSNLSGGGSLLGQRTIVQINNLPNDYSWKSLQDLCSSFGEVTYCKITSRGVGVVHFANEVSAKRALDMLDSQRFEGRYLETRYV